MTADETVVETAVAAPAARVWRALRDPTLIRRWHGWEYDDEHGLDEEIRQIFVDGVVEDAAAMVLTVHGGDRFTVTPGAEGAVVRIVRAAKGSNPEWDDWYDDVTEGWTSFLQQLKFGLERHDLAERCTLYLDGPTGGATVMELLGVAGVTGPPGSAYTALVSTGDALSGTVWFRSPKQLGLTVDQLGPGLLVLAIQPENAQRPGGGAQMILSAYGRGAEEFAALSDRWTNWWNARDQAAGCC
ncbi:SRPBCC domain-containing protein [Rhodococcus spelaei]|uniref:SRPBCC domain-containing protein n=1 Tax=Rhodococcus spelaei TaxID=2546320 RepID=A0A541BP32_9NOCA|nr:SRPBCC domain-containing protein [Rhodococcus spelaei]TQF74095.1 SRPBCC domain-containing protein [Rhodococcus spelaei]